MNPDYQGAIEVRNPRTNRPIYPVRKVVGQKQVRVTVYPHNYEVTVDVLECKHTISRGKAEMRACRTCYWDEEKKRGKS